MAVYIIQAENADGPVKIGFTGNVAERLAKMQNATWQDLKIIRTINGGRDVEAWFHARFINLHIAREWFAFDPEMLTVTPDPSSGGRVGRKLGHEGAMSYDRRVLLRGTTPKTEHAKIIEALGGKAKISKALGLSRWRTTKWHVRGIPSVYWDQIADLAVSKDIPLTVHRLRETKPSTGSPAAVA